MSFHWSIILKNVVFCVLLVSSFVSANELAIPKKISALNPTTISKFYLYISPELNGDNGRLGVNSLNKSPVLSKPNLPKIVKKSGFHFFAVSESHFEIANLSEKDLGIDNFTLFAVVDPDSKLDLSDFWSWGDCDHQRFLIHLPLDKKRAHAMFGDPVLNALDIPLTTTLKHPYIVSLQHSVASTTFAVNKSYVRLDGEWNSLNPKIQTLTIGNGACGHQYKGLVGDVFYINQSLDPKTFAGVYKFFEQKYQRKYETK